MGKKLYEDSNTYVLPHIHLEDYPGFKPAGTINPNIYAVHEWRDFLVDKLITSFPSMYSSRLQNPRNPSIR